MFFASCDRAVCSCRAFMSWLPVVCVFCVFMSSLPTGVVVSLNLGAGLPVISSCRLNHAVSWCCDVVYWCLRVVIVGVASCVSCVSCASCRVRRLCRVGCVSVWTTCLQRLHVQGGNPVSIAGCPTKRAMMGYATADVESDQLHVPASWPPEAARLEKAGPLRQQD